MPGPRGQRSVLAPAGHPAVDQPGVAGQADIGADAEAFGDAGPEPLHEHVGAFDQGERRAGSGLLFEVQQHGALVAVGDVVLGCDPEGAAARPVHADHVGPEVGQCHGGERPRPDPGELDHPHSGQRAPAGGSLAFLRCCHRAPSTVTQLM
ncbi:hypothetical protein AN220_24090 [Streptomyces nanshensis]|nr:hypothetical protein AN220_24090 [Streptomyces nanshensis]